MLQNIYNSIFGNYNDKAIKNLRDKYVPKINALEEEFQTLSESELKAKFAHWREVLTEDPTKVDEYMVRVFAGVKNAARRISGKSFDVRGKDEVWNMVHFDVQLVGGIILHQGAIAEMKTGEGKTLVCTLPVILNALTSRGVHLVTVNDYLAARDAEWMKPLYEYCGLSVGILIHGVTPTERKEAYAADITYGTNNEFGFDYLRDNMAQHKDQLVQRELHYAIVDEVDSILIDEARTPLIISSPAEESTEKYIQYSQMVPRLKENEDYNIDIKMKAVTLSENGITKMEQWLGVQNIYTDAGFEEVHHIEQALKANIIFEKDKDYVVRDDQIIIVDEFTGRLMPGRRYSDGLHQALEAKEKVQIQRESKTLATVTFQNYFRLYEKLAGMTGTAETEAEEFGKIYKLDTLVVPTNRPIARQDLSDKIFKNERGKFIALAREVKELNKKGQPVLVGTVSIEKSEALSHLLHSEGVAHEVLNAKQHEREAEIVMNAGKKGAVTIATNMAGRGTDIKISDEVKELGGLAVLGTERHESRRIDNQLRGRSGRQGDPGFSQFYVAMTDELMRRFGGTKMASIMERLNFPEDQAIEMQSLSNSVQNAQKKIEAFHFDARKHVVQYDDVMNVHRENIYKKRRAVLFSENINEIAQDTIERFVVNICEMHCPTPQIDPTKINYDELFETVRTLIKNTPDNMRAKIENFTERAELETYFVDFFMKSYEEKKETFPEDKVNEIMRFVILKSIDELWLEHINNMTNLRDRVSLSGFAQKHPIMEYKRMGFDLYKKLLFEVRSTAIGNLFRVEISPAFQMKAADYSDARTNKDQIQGNLRGGETGPQQPYRTPGAPEGLTRAERRRMAKAKKRKG